MIVTMQDYTITDRAPVLIGYEGENLSRNFTVKTFDDLSAIASIELLIGDVNCGAMTVNNTDDTEITISLDSFMIGKAGYKKAQLIMLDDTGAVVMKSNQFDVLVGASNNPRYYAAGEKVKTLTVSIDGRTRQIILPASFAVSVNGDVAVDHIAFKAPASYGDFDFGAAACRVDWTGVDGTSHKNICTEKDADGNWIWALPTALTRGGEGEIAFSVSYVVTDNGGAVTADWNTGLVKFYHLESAKSDDAEEDVEDETTYDRLASAIAAVRAAQASVDDVNAILAGITSATPTVVETVADLNGLDTSKVKLAIVAADGYLYYYNGTAWISGFAYGGLQEVIAARTDSAGVTHADLKTRLNTAEAQIKEDLGAKVDKNGVGQILPKNINGVTVCGGNILDDGERLYSTQSGASTTDGYVSIWNGDAIIQTRANYCSFLIPVTPNTHYTANNSIRFAVLLKNLSSDGTSPVRYSTVVGSALANISSFDTGEADHIIVSWNYNTYSIDSFIISEGDTPTTDKTITIPDWLKGEDYSAEIESIETRLAKLDGIKPKFVSTTGNLSDGTFLALMGYKQNLRKGERYVFSGNISTISSLHFGFTNANAFSASTKILNEFTIDATNITYKTDSTNENYTNQYAHGLTLANNLQFVFEYLPEGNAKITLMSNGAMFTQTLLFFKKTISQVVVLSTGSTLTDCKLTWTPNDIEKTIWMFGDSYFAYAANRWPYYLQQYGYAKNTLIDGWPGEGSVNARNSLMTLIQFGTPKYILWCMGMNDGSDTDASTPSSNWTERRDEMLTICNNNGITPIFATIPNVPSILHTGKNAWIKASGYRYIDFAKAVGAESAGSTWFTGMLSVDNVHPTEQGARALFARVLLDFPEIMLDD